MIDRLARVFPRRTKATPTDPLAFVGPPDLFAAAGLDCIERVHVSVAFDADRSEAERLARQWERVAPVEIGGPAVAPPSGPFVPGRYLKPGRTITSRGCPNRCWFCRAGRQTPEVQELPITDGHRLLDDNLLACSQTHVRAVFAMLAGQPHRAEFTGGLDPERLADWVVNLLAALRPEPAIFLAYDTPADLEPVTIAAQKLRYAGFSTRSHRLQCYVLIGFPGDTLDDARRRLHQTLAIGLTPFAMLYQGGLLQPAHSPDWKRLQRHWTRPALIHQKARAL